MALYQTILRIVMERQTSFLFPVFIIIFFVSISFLCICYLLSDFDWRKIYPSLLFESINAMVDDDICCSACTFLKAFFERLREDCWSSEGVMEGNVTFRRLSLPPIISGIVSGNSKLRTNLNTYALPAILQIDSDAIFLMLAFALESNSTRIQ